MLDLEIFTISETNVKVMQGHW